MAVQPQSQHTPPTADPPGRWRAAIALAASALLLSACAGTSSQYEDDEPDATVIRQRQREAIATAKKQRPPPPAAQCNFIPAHATSRGESVPPSYECNGLSKKQYQAGQCREASAYSREDGTFVSSHTRCLANPLDVAFDVIGVPPAAILPNTSGATASTPAGAPPAPRPWGDLLLPSDDGSGIDQGNDTFVKPIIAPGSVDVPAGVN